MLHSCGRIMQFYNIYVTATVSKEGAESAPLGENTEARVYQSSRGHNSRLAPWPQITVFDVDI